MSGLASGDVTKRSYQHWPPQMLYVAYPGLETLESLRVTNDGAPVATSSLRENWAAGLPVLPSTTYIRLRPSASLTTSNAGLVWITLAFRDGLICVHVAPASGDRQIPRAYEPAYRMLWFDGSISKARTPRGEQVEVFANSGASPWQS